MTRWFSLILRPLQVLSASDDEARADAVAGVAATPQGASHAEGDGLTGRAGARSFHALRDLASLVRPHRKVLVLVMVCLMMLSGLQLAMPKVLKYVIDHVFIAEEGVALSTRRTRLLVVLPVVLVIYLLRNGFYYLEKTRTMAVGEKAAFGLRERLLKHLHTLSIDYYQRNNPGKISARLMQDVQSIKQFLQDELDTLGRNIFLLLLAVAILLEENVLLALVSFLVMPFHVLVYYVFRKPISTYARQAKEQIADVSGDLVQQFDAGGAVTVKASATQAIEQEKFRRSMRRGMKAQIKQNKYYTLQKIAADMLVGLGLIVLFGVGGVLVLKEGGMDTGAFVSFYVYVGMLYPVLPQLVSQAGRFTRTATSIERVTEILSIEPSVREKDDAVPYEITHGRIEFRDVSFTYETGAAEQVLEDVSFTIEPNEHVLITGPSGGGKSTCVNLIARFYDPTEGSIHIDGVDLRDFTLASLRRQIGFVFQDCFLFNDTIMANIRYAWPEASNEAVIDASCNAGAHEFVQKLPEGYNTLIGEGGVQISAGQKRRLMIARAILKNPRILILDEPLVSLDHETRRRAIQGLATLIGTRTVLTITHYPAELPNVDKQMHIADGRATVRDLSGRVLQF